jgi:two-component system CheB/CheR fusion protein
MNESESPNGFEDLLDYVNRSHDFDFRGYKRSTLRRRIKKRMQEAGASDFAAYFSLLEAEPREYAKLLDSILINVTSFFRDEPAWKVLEETVLPRTVAEKATNEPIRLWSAGCASGEEPYSLAMLLLRLLGPEAYQRRVKIYATDVDESALATARNALYDKEAVNSLPRDMLEEYFEPINGRFAFRRDLRKSIIFGRHNLLVDAPISKIDLLSCRNLLIYLDVEAQSSVLSRLHYALNDEGVLFLGKTETQLGQSKMFEPVDVKCRIFRKRQTGAARSYYGPFVGDFRGGSRQALPPRLFECVLSSSRVAHVAVSPEWTLLFANAQAQRLFGLMANDVGHAFQDLQVSYRPIELRSRIEDAVANRQPVRLDDVLYSRTATENYRMTVEIVPIFNENGRHLATAVNFYDDTRLHEAQQQLSMINNMLDTTVEELQSANEELETTNEELQSTNEELDTTNEELQSANEELETINEELRSTNDELETANEELRRRGEQLDSYRVHTELVLGSIRTGVIVLDQSLKVALWNRWNENMWGLRAEEAKGKPLMELDVGLPIEQLRNELRAAQRGETPAPVTLETIDRRGRVAVCEVVISPLGAATDERSGLVLVVEDITDRKRDLASTMGESPPTPARRR